MTVALTVDRLRSFLSVTALRTFLPFSRALTLPSTLTVAERSFAPSGALSLNFSLPRDTHLLAGGRPMSVAMSTGATSVGVGVTRGFGVGVAVRVGAGVGVDTTTVPACHWKPRLSPAP